MPLMRKHFTRQEIEKNVVGPILSEQGGVAGTGLVGQTAAVQQ